MLRAVAPERKRRQPASATCRCRGCGLPKDRAEFDVGDGRRNHLCRACHARRVRATWDWADAVIKSAKRTASARKIPFHMKPETIRAIYGIQQGRCALTGRDFEIPGTGELRHGQTLARWSGENIRRAERCPRIERVDLSLNFSAGNVMLISTVVQPLYRSAGGLDEYRDLLVHLCDVTVEVPGREAILEAEAQA